jgi:hypothetical protein
MLRTLALVLVALTAHCASPPCVTPCEFAMNLAWDSAGTPDTQPGHWGNQSQNIWTITFVNVPKGYQVQLVRIDGDQILGFHGGIPKPGSSAYALIGVYNSTAQATPYVYGNAQYPVVGSSGMPLFYQSPVSVGRVPINLDVSASEPLALDNHMLVKEAEFLNDTGVSVHMEFTASIQFKYVLSTSIPVGAKSPTKASIQTGKPIYNSVPKITVTQGAIRP